jgi:pyruvate kinase
MPTEKQLKSLIRELETLHSDMLRIIGENQPVLTQVEQSNQASATNLLHYLALRRRDIRGAQEQLAALGLSSLGRTEAHVLSSVEAVISALDRMIGHKKPRSFNNQSDCDHRQGRKLLERNTEQLLGAAPEERKVRIMVTMPPQAATDYGMVRDLLLAGMNCMRINCAHDGQEAWASMIRNLRHAEAETGKPCKIEMDLGGPKLRTGSIEPFAPVVKFRPKRDTFGRVVEPAKIWLTRAAHPVEPTTAAAATLPVPERWLSRLKTGDVIRFVDTRGAQRRLTVRDLCGKGVWAECSQTCYVAPGTVLRRSGIDGEAVKTKVGNMPGKPQAIVLCPGDRLILTRSLDPGHPARFGEHGELLSPARIPVTLPEFFGSVLVGQPIWFDDGKIGGVIESVNAGEVEVLIEHAKPGGDKLGAEKGINVPETRLDAGSLTAEDLDALPFVARNADIVGYSFVRSEVDVKTLRSHLAELGASDLAIMLKIETREGFDNLPGILLAAMASRSAGVMIARGDLAIECGFQRLAEVQEEILWISEAAHMPVVWATQVLESLAKTGRPSRSEITDAAMGERAECVMLNKGPYVLQAVRALNDILRRMQSHQQKRSSLLRRLSVAASFDMPLETAAAKAS